MSDMISFLQKYFPFISAGLLVALIVSLFLCPSISGPLGIILILSGLGMALFFTIQKYVQPYKGGEISGLKFTRNVLLDILSLLLTIAAASYLGGIAGTRLGASFGLWAGLIAGILSAFAVAWGVRKLWSKLVRTR